MIIPLERVPACIGSYDIDRDGKAREMPVRALWLAPDAAKVFNADMYDKVVVSDMFRSPDSSKAAVAAGRGAAAPGWSAHNYGRAIDIDVRQTMRNLGLGTKAELDVWMSAHGWWCWREDHVMPAWKPRPNEAWHYYWAPKGVEYIGGGSVQWWNRTMGTDYPPLEWGIPTHEQRQKWLRDAGFYHGEIDGKWGSMSKQAYYAFTVAWGPRTDRTLAYMAWFLPRSRALRLGTTLPQ